MEVGCASNSAQRKANLATAARLPQREPESGEHEVRLRALLPMGKIGARPNDSGRKPCPETELPPYPPSRRQRPRIALAVLLLLTDDEEDRDEGDEQEDENPLIPFHVDWSFFPWSEDTMPSHAGVPSRA